MAENVFDIAQERIFKTMLTTPKSGFYRVLVRYAHSNWDAWLKLDIVGEKGETVTCIPPLPNKYTQATWLVYLFEGENRLTLAPRIDHPMDIREVVIAEENPVLLPQAVPSRDWFYLAQPRDRRLTVVSYTGTPVKITAGQKQIPFVLEDKALYDHADPVETKEPHYYYHLRLSGETLAGLGEGEHGLEVHLPGNEIARYTLTVERSRKDYALRVVSLDANHGNCVLLRLPNGKNLLIDTGTETCADDVLFPYLAEQGIGLDYCLISHYHGDHVGSLDKVLERYPLEKPDMAEAQRYILAGDHEKRAEYLSKFGYLDNKMLCRYDRLDRIWDLGGVEVTVLNSKYEASGAESIPGAQDENGTSVSLLVRYQGFQYYHGADNHAPNQRRNLEDFTAAGRLQDLQCHYMQANHHFHGDMLPAMIRAINPVAVLVPAHQAIYSRSAFMMDYLQDVVEADYPNKRLQDTLVSYMSGTVTAMVNSSDDWHYETY